MNGGNGSQGSADTGSSGVSYEDPAILQDISSGVTHEDPAIRQDEMFACNICYHTAICPVASICGHLFCWECLYTWLGNEARPCPVCRIQLIQGFNIVCIYTGHDSAGVSDDIPPRPHPLPLGRLQGPIPLPSPVDILLDLTDNYEISRARVDKLGRTVEDLVRWHVQLRWEMDGLRRQHAQEIDRMQRQQSQEIDRINRQHSQEVDRINRVNEQEIDRLQRWGFRRQLRQ